MAELTSHEAPAHKAQSLPVQLPGKLVGRDSTLAQVYGQLKANKAVLIHGESGIGKTALAATLASAYTELPGGALWLNVNKSSLPELIVRTGRAYNVLEISASSNPVGMVAAVASTFASSKPLVVIDGEPDPKATADFITRCAGNLPAMILSKEAFEGPWTVLELDKLADNFAISLLKQSAGLESATGLDDDLDELASILDYIPFALCVAGGTMRAAKMSPADYLAEFEKIPSNSGATPQLLALTIGFRKLSNAFQGVLLLLGATFGMGTNAELLSMMAGAPQETTDQVMNTLVNNHLVERFHRYDSPYYQLHEITSTFATAWLRPNGRLESLQGKVRDSVLAYVKKYSNNSPAAHEKLASAMDLIMAVARWSADQGERDLVNQIVVGLMQSGDFVNERGYVSELLKLREMASSFTSPFPANPASAPVAPEDMDLGDIDADDMDDDDDFDDEEPFDEFDEDEEFDDDLQEDKDDVDDSEDDVGLGIRPAASEAVGSLWKSVEQSKPPAPAAAQTVPVSPAVPAKPANSLLDLDEEEDEDEDTEVDLDDDSSSVDSTNVESSVDEAPVDELTRLQNGLRQARQQNDLKKQVEWLDKLGQLEASRGMDNEAIATYTEALAAYEKLDEPEHILQLLDTLSVLMVKTENSSAAVLHATRGITLAEELDDVETKMHILITLADARQQLGESEDAVRSYSQALEIARTEDDAQNEALILYKLGYAQLDSSQPDIAAETWEQALKLFKTQGKRDYEGRVLGGLGTAYGDLDRWTEAINFHNSALYIAREVKDRDVEALELSNLGYASYKANQLGQALIRYRQSLHLAYETNNRENIVSNIVDIVRLLAKSPKHLAIADLLLNDAIPLDPTDRDVLKLKEVVTGAKMQAIADNIEMLPVSGTAKDYAANAYKMLEG
ncbi:MAG: tetratricopeptide repeat protein [Anaerolineaceae bacterium]|nr:tetratricopeptide repeat protein [Anaerolineaceae bacterium]